jgi:hypothetical protein
MKYILNTLLTSFFFSLFIFSQSVSAQVYVQSVWTDSNTPVQQTIYNPQNSCGSNLNYSNSCVRVPDNFSRQKYPELCSALVRTLKPGSTGNDIRQLQLVLGQEGILYLDITGTMSKATQRAIKIYQLRNGLTQTGFVGPKTLSLMQEQWCSGNRDGLVIPANPEPYPTPYPTPNPYYPTVPTFPTVPYPGAQTDISIYPSNTSSNSVTITWDGKNSSSCRINNEQVQVAGSRTYSIYTATNYTLSCFDNQNNISSKTILVNPNATTANLPTVTVSLNPQTAIVGQTATVSWTSQNTTYCMANFSNNNNYYGNNNSNLSTSGSQQVTITSGQQSFTVSCYNSAGLNSAQTVYANGTNLQPTGSVNVISNLINVGSGQPVQISWAGNANLYSCTLTANGLAQLSNQQVSGNYTFYPTVTTTYAVTCRDQYSNNVSGSVVVNVVGTTGNIPTLTVTPTVVNSTPGAQTTVTLVGTNINNTQCYVGISADTNVPVTSEALGNSQTNFTRSYTVSGYQNRIYTFSCVGLNGQTVTTTLNLIVNGSNANPAPTVTVVPTSTNINLGQSLGIRLSATNVSSCSVSGGSYTNAPVQLVQTLQYPNYTSTGFLSVSPTTNTNYTFNCIGTNGQSVAASSVVNINGTSGGTPTANIYASQSNISTGQPVTLTWNSANATTCTLSGNGTAILSNQNSSGTYLVYPSVSTNYQISCVNSGAVAANSYVYVTVNSTNVGNSGVTILTNSNRNVTIQITKAAYTSCTSGYVDWGDGQAFTNYYYPSVQNGSTCSQNVTHNYSGYGSFSIRTYENGALSATTQVIVQ